LGWWRIPDSNR